MLFSGWLVYSPVKLCLHTVSFLLLPCTCSLLSPQVLQNGRITTVDSTELLPGDVMVVHPGILPCDVALVR